MGCPRSEERTTDYSVDEAIPIQTPGDEYSSCEDKVTSDMLRAGMDGPVEEYLVSAAQP